MGELQTAYHLDSIVTVSGNTYAIKDLTYEDLRCKVQTGQSILVRGEGRNKIFRYRDGCMTKLGDIEQSEWRKIVHCLITEKYKEDDLYIGVLDWVQSNAPWITKENEREFHALDMMASRLIDSELWVGFLPFNKRYRPEKLNGIKTVWIIPECCKKPGLITKARYDMDICGTSDKHEWKTFCPHCGRYSRFT